MEEQDPEVDLWAPQAHRVMHMCTHYHKHKGTTHTHTNIHKLILRHRKVVEHSKHTILLL